MVSGSLSGGAVYFISQVDLVDTLSKGKFPPAVQEHFSKFTDNIGGIKWDKDPEDPSKEIGVAMGMTSGDREKVAFATPHDCRGPVEEWLLDLMAHCCNMMREQLEQSISGFIDTPRDVSRQRREPWSVLLHAPPACRSKTAIRVPCGDRCGSTRGAPSSASPRTKCGGPQR